MNPTVGELIASIEKAFPPQWQEDFDNTGWQILLPGVIDTPCSGMLLCVDVTPEVIEEARERDCNLILAHHPLIFRPLKKIVGFNRVDSCIIDAIKAGVSVYSCHTPVDLSPEGVSAFLARGLGLEHIEFLSEGSCESTGIGMVGDLPCEITFGELVDKIKTLMNSPVARCSGLENVVGKIKRVAVGGGACADLIPRAVAKGAQVMITSDVKHNYFLDFNQSIAVVDLGHYETEQCTKEIFYNVVRKKFPNFVPYYSNKETNPITYL